MEAAHNIDFSTHTTCTTTKIAEQLEIKNYIYPAVYLSDEQFSKLLKDLDTINKDCITNLTYGIFNPSYSYKKRKELLTDAFVVITYNNGKPVAANHGFIYTDPSLPLPIFYFGLTQNNSKLQMDLTGLMHMLTVNLLSFHYHEAIAATITIHPRIAETMDLMAEQMFPSPHYKSKRPPKSYPAYAQKVINSYAIPFWATLGEVAFNPKSFTLSLTSKEETGYDKETFEDSVKAEDWIYDLFFEHKLNWDKNEDMLLMGKVTPTVFQKIKAKLTQVLPNE